jgi:hypothetical protein
MIKSGIDLNYVKFQGVDKHGRPCVWLRMKYFNPAVMTREVACRLMCYMLDYVNSEMRANVDTCVMIYDMSDFGYSNFSKDLFLGVMEVSSVSYNFLLSIFSIDVVLIKSS